MTNSNDLPLNCNFCRMNGAVIKGYEEDVGNKTSVYVYTAHSLVSGYSTLKKFGFKSIPHDEVGTPLEM